MIVIYAEKPDMGTKIAAALDGVYANGKKYGFEDLNNKNVMNQIKYQRSKDGWHKINYNEDDTFVTWGYGHMCELKQAKDYNPEYKNWRNIPLPYIPEKYEIKLKKGIREQFQTVKKLFNQADLIICATDDDREGDLIFYYVYEHSGTKKPFKRALFNKQSKEEFIKAFKEENLKSAESRKNVISAGKARSEGDFIVGAGPTVAMTLSNNSKDVLSVGRVQTATLQLFLDRENAIRNFKSTPFWNIESVFTTSKGDKYTGKLKNVKRITEKAKADNLLKELKNPAVVLDVNQKTKKQGKPNLHSLPTLQMEANKRFGFSLNKTLTLAQDLYEKGYISYPRTDSCYLPMDMEEEVKSVLNMLLNVPEYSSLKNRIEFKVSPYYFDNEKVTGHYAIVPTSRRVNFDELTKDEEKIYKLVAEPLIIMILDFPEIRQTTILTETNGYVFETKGTVVQKEGYYELTGRTNKKDEILPKEILIGDMVNGKYEAKAGKTEPPKYFTDRSLLKAMMTCGKEIEDEELRNIMAGDKEKQPLGLGRPSTQAGIVETLLGRKYIKREGKRNLRITEKGENLLKLLPVEELKSPEMTAKWELRLDKIEHGTDSYKSFMTDLEKTVRIYTNEILENNGGVHMENNIVESAICPKCGGDIADKGKFYGCNNYSESGCDFTLPKEFCRVILNDEDITMLTRGMVIPPREYISKKGKKFTASLKLDNSGSLKLEFQPRNNEIVKGVTCPACGSPLKDMGWGLSCSAYPECKFSLGFTFPGKGGKKLNKTEYMSLISGNPTKIKNIPSKKGKKYDATVTMTLTGDGEKKYDFSFD